VNRYSSKNSAGSFDEVINFSKREAENLPRWAQQNARFQGGFSLRDEKNSVSSRSLKKASK
jgi:hypothetical protein